MIIWNWEFWRNVSRVDGLQTDVNWTIYIQSFGLNHTLYEQITITLPWCIMPFNGVVNNNSFLLAFGCENNECVHGECIEDRNLDRGYRCQCEEDYGDINCQTGQLVHNTVKLDSSLLSDCYFFYKNLN